MVRDPRLPEPLSWDTFMVGLWRDEAWNEGLWLVAGLDATAQLFSALKKTGLEEAWGVLDGWLYGREAEGPGTGD